MKAISYYYLVDMENVGLQGLYGLNMPEEDSAIILFISNNFHMATEEIQEDILKSKADISTIFCSVMRKNAMDFQMAAYFGSVLNKPETKRVSIISQDGGFKALQDYAGKVQSKVKVYQCRNILEAFVTGQNMKGLKMYAKGRTVDFKHVMEALRKKQEQEDPVSSRLAAILTGEEIDAVLAIMMDPESGPRQKYLGFLQLLGRKKGTQAYQIMRENGGFLEN